MVSKHDKYILRAIQLAGKADNRTKNNPKVGCVITYKGRIIGEGYHKKYGDAHAEVNAVNSIKTDDREYISKANVYVTLEPCSHHGKTPSCARMLVKNGFKNIYVGTTDPYPLVAGKGIKILRESGCNVRLGIQEEKSKELIREFLFSVNNSMPYVTLKWAQTRNGIMGAKNSQISISGRLTQHLVHKWRANHDGILIGPDTAISDQPSLTNRLFSQSSPTPIILDRNHRIPKSHALFKRKIIYASLERRQDIGDEVNQIIIKAIDKTFLKALLNELYNLNFGRILVEGGSAIHNAFIKENLWNEARIIMSSELKSGDIKAPFLRGKLTSKKSIENDFISIIHNETN